MRSILLLALFLLSLLAPYCANAVIPETGIWWNDQQPGRGYYIDVQGNTLFFIAYSYDNDGSPNFVAGSGTLSTRSGEVLGFGFPTFSPLGYEPWHFTAVELFRFKETLINPPFPPTLCVARGLRSKSGGRNRAFSRGQADVLPLTRTAGATCLSSASGVAAPCTGSSARTT